MRTHTGARPYACSWDGCVECFSRQDSLTSHMDMRTQHSEEAVAQAVARREVRREEEDESDSDEESDADDDDDDNDDEAKAGTAESLSARFPLSKGKVPIKLATKTAQEHLEVLRLTGIITNPLDDEGANAVAQLTSTSESWKQQRTRRVAWRHRHPS